VDRIGQKHPVKAFNLLLADSVELRIQEVLEEKLAIILHEFGVDKTQDVLDSAESNALFEKLYAQAILNPDDLENQINRSTARSPGTGAAGHRRALVLQRNRPRSDAGPTAQPSSVAALVGTDDHRLSAQRRQSGPTRFVQRPSHQSGSRVEADEQPGRLGSPAVDRADGSDG
jgi:hypothetical protein